MAIRIEEESGTVRKSARDMTPGAIVYGVLYDTSGMHPLARAGYYLVSHTGALVSIPDGHLTTNDVVLACYEEYDATLTVRRKS